MVPTVEDQGVYTLGEGPFLIAESNVIRELEPEEVFMWLRAALMHERVAEELPEVRALVPLDGHLFFLSGAVTKARRKEIEDAFIGAYPRSRMHFYVTQTAKDAEVLWAAEEIVAGREPVGWEKLREAA